MLDEHLRFLICPHCGSELSLGQPPGGSLECPHRHTFDVARQGYVSLLSGNGRTVAGDTTEMVTARDAFLGAGHFEPIATVVAESGRRELVRQGRPRAAVDLGAGTGYYLDRLGAVLPPGYGLVAVDISRPAMRLAARRYPRLAAIVADIRQTVPVGTGAAGLVLDTFAPRGREEIGRILAADGSMIVVVPRPGHLAELTAPLDLIGMDPSKRERLERTLEPMLRLAGELDLTYEMRLSCSEVADLVRMGPSARHHRGDEIEGRVAELTEPVTVSAAVSVLTYRRA